MQNNIIKYNEKKVYFQIHFQLLQYKNDWYQLEDFDAKFQN